MRRTALLLPGILLLSTGIASAEDLPDGTFTSSKDGCSKLQAKSLSQLGDDVDFTILTKKGITGYQQACDFVTVTPHDATSWVATAFCNEGGYTYPDFVSIAKSKDGTLNVTRLSDVQNSSETPGDNDSDSDDQSSDDQAKKPGAAASGAEQNSTSSDAAAAASYDIYVPCPNAKQ